MTLEPSIDSPKTSYSVYIYIFDKSMKVSFCPWDYALWGKSWLAIDSLAKFSSCKIVLRCDGCTAPRSFGFEHASFMNYDTMLLWGCFIVVVLP